MLHGPEAQNDTHACASEVLPVVLMFTCFARHPPPSFHCLTSATPAPKVATSRLDVALLKPLSCSHSVKNTIACQGKHPTMP